MVEQRIRSRALATAVALCALIATVGPTGVAAAAPVTIQATQVTVSASCAPGGGYSWVATLSDGGANRQYSVYSKVTYTYNNGQWGGSGGDFSYKYVGVMRTGPYGIGSTNTYSGNLGAGTTSVTVGVKINGVYGSDTDSC